jgi:enoyl-CoA hydratase/carnithine racemase
MAECVDVQVTDGVATIRLDRPPMNAISVQMQADLSAAAATVTAAPAIRAAVIYGGDKTFAAGADVKEMADQNYPEMVLVSQAMHASFGAVATIPKPVVAAVTGYALGGGLELALCADFRVCGESAKFGLPEIQLGIIPGAGGTQRLPRLIGPARAKNLVYTGRHVDAEEALRIGLVSALYEGEELPARVMETARVLAAKSPLALAAAKAALNHSLQGDHIENLTGEAERFAGLFASEDQKEGMAAFIEKRDAIFTGR